MLKQKIAIILVVCLFITLLPVSAFATNTFKVTFDSQGGSAVANNPVSVKSGKKVAKPADPTLDGNFFRGWYTENTTYAAADKWDFATPVKKSITLYAKWAKVCTVTVTWGDNGSVTGLAKDGLYGVGDTAKLTAAPADGYCLDKWTQDGAADPVSQSPVYSFTVTGDVTLSASFIQIGATEAKATTEGFECVRLSWTEVKGASGYQVFRSSTPGAYGSTAADTVNYGSVVTVLDSVTSSSKFYYVVRAFSKSGSTMTYGPFSPEVSATAQNLKPALTASPDGYYSIKLSWDYVPSAAGYAIYRAVSQDGNYAKLKTVSDTTYYSNTGLKAGQTYFYKIIAYKGSCYSESSDAVSATSQISSAVLKAMSYDDSSIRLSWDPQSGANGYELCRSASADGSYKLIYTAKSAPTGIYINGLRENGESALKTGDTYYYKIRSYRLSGSKKIYSPYSDVVSAKAGDKDNDYDDPAFALYKQGDDAWGFSDDDAKNACLLTSYAIIVKNLGIDCTPKTLFESNGYTRYMTITSFNNMAANFGVIRVPALSRYSPLFGGFDGTATLLKKSANQVSAIKEALDRNPEGVIVYFKNKRHMHAFVACKYQGDILYFSDPGTSLGGGDQHLILFSYTWVAHQYKFTYRNLFEIIALDKIQN